MVTTLALDEFECQLSCLSNDTCQSFNVHPNKRNRTRICELNSNTRQKNPMILNGRKDLHAMVWSRYGRLRLLILCVGIDFNLLIILSYVVLFHKWNTNN